MYASTIFDIQVASRPLWLILIAGPYTVLQTMAVIWFLTYGATKPGEVATWAESYRLRLTHGNVALVRGYVRLAITVRVVGGVAGAYLGYLTDRAFGVDSSAGAGFWTWVVGGWLIGALWAQRQVAAPTAGTGVASLTPRRLSDYLPGGLRWAPLAATLFIVASTIAIRVTFEPDVVGLSTPSTATLVIGLTTCALVTGLVRLTEAHIIGQRQAPSAADVLAADEAIRTSTVHQVAGAGTAMICTMGISLWFAMSDHAASMSATAPIPILLTVGAFVSWRYFTYRSWQVRRSVGTAPHRVSESAPT